MQPRIDDLIAELRRRGSTVIDGLIIKHTTKGYGLFTQRSIDAGETIVYLNPKSVVTTEVPHPLKDYHYCRVVPSDYHNHILARLCAAFSGQPPQGDMYLNNLEEVSQAIADTCELLRPTMRSIMDERNNHISKGGNDNTFLLRLTRRFSDGFYPLIDMVNHDHQPNCTVSDRRLTALKDIPAGSELTIVYKLTSFYDLTLLMDIPILAENYLLFSMDLPAILTEKQRRYLNERRLCDRNAKTISFTLCERGATNATMSIFRILHLVDSHLPSGLVSLLTDNKVCRDLRDLCMRLLPTETDEDPRLRIIVDIRRKIAQILTSTVQYLEGEWLKYIGK